MPLRTILAIVWGAFWVMWLLAALGAKQGTRRGLTARFPGLGVELVTSGPYRYVRHPIYSGILLGFVGTGLATNLYWFIGFVVIGAYFIYSATVEERLMKTSFPKAYPEYRARTRMLIPFLL